MLPPVKRQPLLMRRQPREAAEVDVGVMTGDIDIRVMQDDVLPPPHVGAAPNQLQGHGHQLVDPEVVGVRVMSAVVLHVESNPGGRQPEQDGQQQALRPGLGHEH